MIGEAYRLDYARCRKILLERLREPAPGRLQLLTGPRQVGTWGLWAVEVKTARFHSGEVRGLLEFCRRHPRYRPLVVTSPGSESIAARLGIAAVCWTDFLLSGPPGVPG